MYAVLESVFKYENIKRKLLLRCGLLCFLILFLLAPFSFKIKAQSLTDEMIFVKGGSYVPLYGNDSLPVRVQDFSIDKFLVTNAQYEDFLKKYTKWNKDKVKAIFADQGYLKHWKSNELTLDNEEHLKNSPVVNVSWFAAKAYCECLGKRLPTVDEWEYAAAASEDKPNASDDISIQIIRFCQRRESAIYALSF